MTNQNKISWTPGAVNAQVIAQPGSELLHYLSYQSNRRNDVVVKQVYKEKVVVFEIPVEFIHVQVVGELSPAEAEYRRLQIRNEYLEKALSPEYTNGRNRDRFMLQLDDFGNRIDRMKLDRRNEK